MHLLYNIGIQFLGFSMKFASLFNAKAKKWVLGRKNFFNTIPKVDSKVYWFHCASLGEFDQGLPLMKLIKDRNPEICILVTFFSPSGMEHYAKRDHHADFVYYLPLDTQSNAKRFINHFQPEKCFFIKYEFWSNFIFEAKKQGSEVYNVSGLFRADHRFFKWYGGFFRKTLKKFDWFFVQNSISEELLKSIDIKNVSISGDSRYDRVLDNKAKVSSDAILEKFKDGRNILIAGSSWPKDEGILLPAIHQLKDEKIIIAPHNVDEQHINSICSELKENYQRYTSFDKNKECKVLILDTIGHLSNAYSYGTYAYVGGGFSGNLHNILEPAVFGLPVIFGPKHQKFPEGQQFIDAGFGFSVDNTNEILSSVKHIKNHIEDIRTKELDFIKSNAGTAEKIYQKITSS